MAVWSRLPGGPSAHLCSGRDPVEADAALDEGAAVGEVLRTAIPTRSPAGSRRRCPPAPSAPRRRAGPDPGGEPLVQLHVGAGRSVQAVLAPKVTATSPAALSWDVVPRLAVGHPAGVRSAGGAGMARPVVPVRGRVWQPQEDAPAEQRRSPGSPRTARCAGSRRRPRRAARAPGRERERGRPERIVTIVRHAVAVGGRQPVPAGGDQRRAAVGADHVSRATRCGLTAAGQVELGLGTPATSSGPGSGSLVKVTLLASSPLCSSGQPLPLPNGSQMPAARPTAARRGSPDGRSRRRCRGQAMPGQEQQRPDAARRPLPRATPSGALAKNRTGGPAPAGADRGADARPTSPPSRSPSRRAQSDRCGSTCIHGPMTSLFGPRTAVEDDGVLEASAQPPMSMAGTSMAVASMTRPCQ